MKTGKDYFELLTLEEKEKFKANIESKDFFNYLINNKSKSFKEFIKEGFAWYKSNEGYGYWQAIANRKINKL